MTDRLDLRLGQLFDARTGVIRPEEARRAILGKIASQPIDGRLGRGWRLTRRPALGVGVIATLSLIVVIGLSLERAWTPAVTETHHAPGGGLTAAGLPSNGLLAYETDAGVTFVNPDGTSRRTLDSGEAGVHGSGRPSWSPDGSRLAYWAPATTADGPAWLRIVDAAGEEQQAVDVPRQLAGSAVSWSRSSDTIALSGPATAGADTPSVFIVDLTAPSPQAILVAEHATDPLWSPVKDELLALLLFPDGRQQALATITSDGHAHWLSERNSDGGYSWSPDGRKIVFSNGIGATGVPATRYLLTFAVEDTYTSSVPFRRVDEDSDSFAPAWSPDGSRIAYLRTVPDAATPECHVAIASDVDVDMPDWKAYPLAVLPHDASCEGRPVWSPDGQWLAFATLDPAGLPAGIVLQPLHGSVEPVWLETTRHHVSWQPVWR